MITMLLSVVLAGPVAVPKPIREFLAQHRELHLLTISDVADMVPPGMTSVQAFAVGDATGDGRNDVIAVMVEDRGNGRAWNVVAFNGTPAGFGPPRWILRNHEHPIGMVTVDRLRRKVTVWECFECDSSPWFRWNGESFEEGLWAKGDVLEVAPDGPAGIFSEPDAATAATAQVPVGTEVRVLAAGPRVGDVGRWYRVRVRLGHRTVEGFVDGRMLWQNYGG
jgi:hypothetical protein